MLVIGSQNSSNSQRLTDIGRECFTPSQLIDGVGDIDDAWFEDVGTVLITAGASAPESLVQDVCRYLKQAFGAVIDERSIRTEEVTFPLPKQLRSTVK